MKRLTNQLRKGQHANMSTSCLRLFLVNIAFHVLVVAQNPPTLPATNPVYLDMIYGSEDDPITEFEWYVPHKFYRMTSIVGYLYTGTSGAYYTMPGFRVTFEADPSTSGWPPIDQDFGNVGVQYTPVPVNLNFANELTEVATCVDDIWGPIPTGYKADLERAKFKESDGNLQEMGADYMCDGGISSDNLVDFGGRLIGFKVRVSFAYSNMYMGTEYGVDCDCISSIQMIIDSENCEEAYWEPAASTSVDNNPVIHSHTLMGFTSQVNVSFLTLTNVWSGTCAFTSSLTKPNSESFISYNDSSMTFTLGSTDACDVGDHTGFSLDLQASQHTAYMTNPTATYPFTVHITCSITSLTINPSPGDTSYLIGDTDSNVNAFDLVVLPSFCYCSSHPSYTVTYTKDATIVTQPSFVQGDPAVAKKFDFDGTDPSEAGVYTITITSEIPVDNGTGSNWSTTAAFTLTVTADPCATATLNIQSSILSTPYQILYDIGSGPHDEDFVPGDVVVSEVVTCPLEYAVTFRTGSAISPPFTYDSLTTTFTIDSTDPLDANTYEMTITVNLQGQTNTDSVDFDIVMVDQCAGVTLTINPAILAQISLSYDIGEGQRVQAPDPSIVNISPTPTVSCPVIVFSFDDQSGGPIDPAAFTYDAAAQEFLTETSDPTMKGFYPMRMLANFDGYPISGLPANAELNYQGELIDTCETTTLTINPTLLSTLAIEYTIDDPSHDETLDPSLVTASPAPITSCPGIVFTFEEQGTGLPMDLTVFDYDDVTQIFKTESSDPSKANTYLYKIIANYDGYTNTDTLDFTVIVTEDPCATTSLSIDSAMFLQFPLITYNIKDAAHVETFDNTLGNYVTSIPDVSGSGCPAIVFELLDQTGGALDPTVFSYNLAMAFATYSTDFGKAAMYDIRLTANFIGYTNAAMLDFDVVLLDVCAETTLTINSSILSGAIIMYTIVDTAHVETLDDTLGNAVTESPSVTGYGCPAIEFTIDDRSGGAIDSTVFTHAAPTFTTYSTDFSKAGDHLMRVLANFVGYPTQAEYLFHVTMVDPCAATSLSIDPSILSSLAIDYTINAPPWVENLDINKITSLPDVSAAGCPAILFSFEDTNTGGAIDPALFTYDPIAETFETSSNDFLDAGTHQLRLIANFNGYTNSVFLDFTVTLNDPCSAATLTIDSSILSQVTLSYDIGYTAHVETLDNTLGMKVTASPDVSSFGCPNIVFQVQTQAGGAIDAAVFTFDAVAQTIETESFDLAKADNYPLKLIANFDGYSNTAELDFDMTLVNLCLIGTFTFTPLEFTATTYSIYTTAITLHTDQTAVVQSETVAPCPILEFEVVNSIDNSIADPAVYTQQNTGATDFDLTIETSDIAKISSYSLLVRVKYSGGLYTVIEDSPFTVIIDDPCQIAVLSLNSLFTSTELVAAYFYNIGYGDQSIEVFQADIASTVGHAFCPFYKFDVLDQTGAPLNPTLFNFVDAATNILTTTDPNDLSLFVGVNYLRLYAWYNGDISHYTNVFTFDFTIELVDPCLVGTLTIQPTILTNAAITFNIQTDPAYVLTLLSSEVVESETNPVCPNIVFAFENTVAQSTIDPGVFTYTLPAQDFQVYTQDTSKHDVYLITLTAKYKGIQYTNEGYIDFTVTVVDLCLLPTFPEGSQPALQTESVNYSYDTSSSALFALDEFVPSPIVCTVTYSCTVMVGHRTDICSNLELLPIYGTATFDTDKAEYELTTDDCVNIQPGTYTLQITGTIGTYQDVQQDYSFDLNLVNPCRPECVVSGITTPTIDDIEYTIGDEKIEITFDEFSLDIGTGGCPYTWTYTAELSDATSLPSTYITFDDSMRMFTIYAASGAPQSLEIFLTGQLYGGSTAISKEITFKVEIIEATAQYYHISNTSPHFRDDISSHMNTILFLDGGSKQVINLGPVIDDESNDIVVTFIDNDNSFITLQGEEEILPGIQIPLNEAGTELVLEVDIMEAQAGNYSIAIKLSDYNDTELLSFQQQLFEISIYANNTPPAFVNDNTGLLFTSFNQTQEVQKLSLGEVEDNEGNSWEATFDDHQNNFITFDETEMTINVETFAAVPGNFTASVTLNEYHSQGLASSQTHVFTIEILDFSKESDHPSFYIHSIDQFGVVEVRFSKTMIIPSNITQVNTTVFFAEMESSQSDDDDASNLLDFTWETIEFQQHKMFIQLSFLFPLAVSKHVERDSLRLDVIDPWPLISGDNFLRIKNETSSEQSVPPQVLLGSSIDGIVSAGFVTTNAMRIFMTSNMLVSNLILGSISLLWGFINSLQIVAHIPLLSVILPGNARIVYDVMYKIATFDIIPMDPLLNTIEESVQDIDNSENHSFRVSESCQDAFGSTNPFLNLTLEIVILLGILLITTIVFFLRSAFSQGWFRTATMKLSIRLYPSALLRYGLEEYITISIAALIKLYALDFSSWFEFLSSIFAIALVIVIVIVPFAIWKFLYKNHKHIQEEEFKRNFGTLTESLQHRYKNAMLYNVNFTLRRLGFALLIVVVPGFNWLQTQLLILKCSFSLILIGQIEPFKLPQSNKLELMNETFILCNTYHMIVYSDFVPNVEARYQVGWFNIGLAGTMLLINVLVISYSQLKAFLWKLKMKMLSAKHNKEIKRRQSQYFQQNQYSETASNFTLPGRDTDMKHISPLENSIQSNLPLYDMPLKAKIQTQKRRKTVKVQYKSRKMITTDLPVIEEIPQNHQHVSENDAEDSIANLRYEGNLVESIDHDAMEKYVQNEQAKHRSDSDQIIRWLEGIHPNANEFDREVFRQIGEISSRVAETPEELLQINFLILSRQFDPRKLLLHIRELEMARYTQVSNPLYMQRS